MRGWIANRHPARGADTGSDPACDGLRFRTPAKDAGNGEKIVAGARSACYSPLEITTFPAMKRLSLFLLPLISLLCSASAQTPLPIVFVTQVPPQGNSETVTSIGNNHLPGVASAPRGGDLMIRYTDGSIRFLTREAGYGLSAPDQGIGAIAVRDPHIHWSGQRILFSMVVNSANPEADRWQLYEATGFEQTSAVQITRVANQPAAFNNVQPCYGPDDRIIYVSDRTLDGTLATWPALDEKGQGRINTGLWSLNPQTGDVFHMEHSPSGSFDPFVDSYGRVLFTRWDHLQRDEKVNSAIAFDYSSESANATYQPGVFSESFPEPLNGSGADLGLRFDLFMPWTVNPDGTELVTLNHVGRHEFSPAALRSRMDSNLTDLVATTAIRAGSLMQLAEHNMVKGRIYGTDAIFNGLSAGRILNILSGAPTVNPSSMQLRLSSGSGILRDPAILTGGKLIVSAANAPIAPNGTTLNLGSSSYASGADAAAAPPVVDPNARLDATNPFRLRVSNAPAAFITNLTFPIILVPNAVAVTVFNHDHNGTQTFSGPLWELQPVEVRPATRPTAPVSKMESPEREMFMSAGVSPLALKSWMRSNDLALMTVRNVTQRDSADHQQPTNLSVPGGVSSVKADGGPTYSVKALQLFQGEYLRGYQNAGTTARRNKATTVRPVAGISQTPAGLPEGSAEIAADGSVAALVPARRATSWQLTEHNGSPVVRERYWLSFQAGEIRSCTSCHGVNSTDQVGNTVATNSPTALRTLLEAVKQSVPQISATSTFQVWSEAALGVPLTAAEDDDADGTANMIEWGMGSSPVNRADRPATPLTVTVLNSAGGRFASVSFSHSLTEPSARTIIESSADLNSWNTVISLGSTVATAPGYSLSRVTNAGGKTETVTLTSTLATDQTAERYFRLRVSAED